MSESQPTRSGRVSRTPADTPPRGNSEVAAMIDAEVSEGGPLSAVPCDTPAGASVAPTWSPQAR